MEVKTYTVTTERSGSWWAFSVPEIPGAHGQARRLEQVRDEARDVISMMLDAEPDSFDISLSVRLDPRIEHALDEAKAARQELDSYQRVAQEKLRLAAEQIKEIGGLSFRDIGSLLDVSFQRISQILSDQRKVS
ncbi:MAG: type II toxin-antitoxin system HicB family antitoxin [Acidimicrobiales bacterium]